MARSEAEAEAVLRAPFPGLAAQADSLLSQRGHAWLLHGPSGLGQYELALWLARSWLCENQPPWDIGSPPETSGGSLWDAPEPGLSSATGLAAEAGETRSRLACGHCAGCHAVDVRAHADLMVLMPEVDMIERGWPLSEKAQSDIDEKRRKPSREIRVEAMRDAIEFAQRTSARGRGLVVLVYPAERMNGVTANALLKTLEEPAGNSRFVLATESAQSLLPTIRSRCQAHAMHWPTDGEALQWLQQQGLSEGDAEVLLQAAGGRPLDALALQAAGISASDWQKFPGAMRHGSAQAVAGWPPAMLLSSLHKLCHDQMVVQAGGQPRFFSPDALRPEPRRAAGSRPGGAGGPATQRSPQATDTGRPSSAALAEWQRQLMQAGRHIEHPWHAGLLTEHLVAQAAAALHSGSQA